MGEGEFATDLRRRVGDTQQALELARAEGDHYAVDVRVGELDSVLRAAMENGVDVDVAESVEADPGVGR